MKAAIALVDELLMGPAANDPKVRQSLVKLRQLLSESPDGPRTERRHSSSWSTDNVDSTKNEITGSTVSGYERSSEGSEEYLNEMRPGHLHSALLSGFFSGRACHEGCKTENE